jgi:hypothetical protein
LKDNNFRDSLVLGDEHRRTRDAEDQLRLSPAPLFRTRGLVFRTVEQGSPNGLLGKVRLCKCVTTF